MTPLNNRGQLTMIGKIATFSPFTWLPCMLVEHGILLSYTPVERVTLGEAHCLLVRRGGSGEG